ncbi:MAG TPA: hypothetical protein VGK49_03180, partial [Ilumatobacteraceae bacterium]
RFRLSDSENESMNGPPRKRAAKPAQKPATRANVAKVAAKRAAPEKSAPVKPQAPARNRAPETTVAAVERALKGVEITSKRAVLAATVRRLAAALDAAEPTDVAKVSKELTARMAEVLAEVKPDGGDRDWTEGDGAPAGGNVTQLRPRDDRRAGRGGSEAAR